jgi:hypothetical protein
LYKLKVKIPGKRSVEMPTITKANARSRMKAKNIPVNLGVAFLSGSLGTCCSRTNDHCDDKCIENFIINYLNDEKYKKTSRPS